LLAKLTAAPQQGISVVITADFDPGGRMASVFPGSRSQVDFYSPAAAPRLARAMTRHASMALLTFAVLQVLGIIAFSQAPGGAMLPFVALGLLLLLAIPFSRAVERRWARFANTALPSPGLLARFRDDRARLWRLACIVPTAWLGLFAAMSQAAP